MNDDAVLTPAPMLSQMLLAISELPKAAPVLTGPSPTSPVELQVPVTEPMSQEELYARFRVDMRMAGLGVYDVTEDMLGFLHDGPAVNVRDPQQAIAATHLTLASHALAPGLWRMYPVLAPLNI